MSRSSPACRGGHCGRRRVACAGACGTAPSVAERPAPSSREQTGTRAAKNVGVRALAEIVGKLATLILFGVMARELGETRFGIFIFALAYLGIVITPVGLGMDPYLLRVVAADRARAP